MEAPLIIFLVLLLLVGPILGIIAFVGMRRLDEALRRQNPQDLTARIYALEQRLAKLEKLGIGPPPPVVATSPEPKPVAAPPAATPPPPAVASVVPPAKPRELAPTSQPSLTGFAPPPLHTSLPRDSDSADLETVIAGRWFNRIG